MRSSDCRAIGATRTARTAFNDVELDSIAYSTAFAQYAGFLFDNFSNTPLLKVIYASTNFRKKNDPDVQVGPDSAPDIAASGRRAR